jgi:hypothetical protein
MERKIAYPGTMFTVAYARDRNGEYPAETFFLGLDRQDQFKLSALFRFAGDLANFSNHEKFGDLGDGLFEFKSFQIRMPFAYAKKERHTILITHGFIKKKTRTPKEEIARARRILEEHQAIPGLTIVRKPK